MDVPTVIFLESELLEIRKSAELYFEALEEVRIFHTTPQSTQPSMCLRYGMM